MYPAYAKWIKSHRDLPLKLNQWNNVVVCTRTCLKLLELLFFSRCVVCFMNVANFINFYLIFVACCFRDGNLNIPSLSLEHVNFFGKKVIQLLPLMMKQLMK